MTAEPFMPRAQRPMPRGLLPLLRGAAFAAAFFCAIVGSLLVLNARQVRTLDPLSAPALRALAARAAAEPANTNLVVEARAMDLLARRAFFSSQAFAQRGAILLLVGAVLCVLALRAGAKISPSPVARGVIFSSEAAVQSARAGRRALTIYGCVLLAGAGALAFGLRGTCGKVSVPVAVAGGAPNPDGKRNTEGTNAVVAASTNATPAAAGTTNSAVAAAPAGDAASEAEMLSNWPAFRGHRGLGGAVTNAMPVKWDGAKGEGIAWKTEVPLPGPNSPIVWGDRVYLTGSDGTNCEVFCFDAGTGALRWRHAVKDIPGSPTEPPKVADDAGLNASSMATDGRRVFAIFATGDVVACDPDGKRVWGRNLGVPKNHYGHSSSLVTLGNRLYVQYDQEGGGSVMALDTATGAEVWKTARGPKPSWTSPIVADAGGKPVLIVFSSPLLTAYDANDGKEVWKLGEFEAEIGASPAAADGRVFAGAEYASLVAADAATGKQLWKVEEALPEVSAPLPANGLLFVPTSAGEVTCYDPATGTKHWAHEFAEGFYSSPATAGGLVYLTDRNGLTHVFKAAKTFEAVGDSPLGEKCMTTFAFAGGRIFVRGEKHLFAIGAAKP